MSMRAGRGGGGTGLRVMRDYSYASAAGEGGSRQQIEPGISHLTWFIN